MPKWADCGTVRPNRAHARCAMEEDDEDSGYTIGYAHNTQVRGWSCLGYVMSSDGKQYKCRNETASRVACKQIINTISDVRSGRFAQAGVICSGKVLF